MYRAMRRADRIRDKLGWSGSILSGCGDKPKGMHWRTYDRLSQEYDAIKGQAVSGLAEKLGITTELQAMRQRCPS